jgi:NSS family neurotransmitter:Na+ symporter
MKEIREHWGSKLGFLLAAIGSAIGLGVLWKFPYTVGQNGGGYFLLAFLICLLLIGIPVFVAELLLGRHSQKAAILAFQESAPHLPFWKIAGWLSVLSSFLIMSFYSVISGYGLSYILMSLTKFYEGKTAQEVAETYNILAASGDISILWHGLFTLITMAIVFSGVRQGIEFWSKIMTRALFVILFGLFLFSMTLDGFKQAFAFIFLPNLENFHFSSVIEALGLAFFILSLGQGIMISYGSYMRKDDNIPFMSLIVGGSVIVVAILSAMVVFPVVFSFGYTPKAGPGLIFQTLPFLFSKLPGGVILSIIFFILFVFTALTSAVAFIEVVATNLMELFKLTRKKAVLLVGGSTFIFGIPSALACSQNFFGEWKEIYGMNFLDNVDYIVSIWIIPFAGLFTAIFVGWVLDHKVTKEEFLRGHGNQKLWLPWIFLIKYVVPVLILVIILQKSGMVDLDQLIF